LLAGASNGLAPWRFLGARSLGACCVWVLYYCNLQIPFYGWVFVTALLCWIDGLWEGKAWGWTEMRDREKWYLAK
jgi:hypothetical protein